MSIAGSDSGGGAGIQADLKTFDAFGAHGLTAITCVTAQNTRGVRAIHAVPGKILEAQLDALFGDFPVGAVKIGMLGSAATARRVAAALRRYRPPFVVLDPVMVATTGARLSSTAAVRVLHAELLPLADLVTPNLPEAEAMTGLELHRDGACEEAIVHLLEGGARAVLLKGGHGRGRQVVDRLHDGTARTDFIHPRRAIAGHGTGCTLASAIAARLAQGFTLKNAVRDATDFVARGIGCAYRPGKGEISILGHALAAPRNIPPGE
jgi:hydroxymethylpyrimidine/phosphomethylpyrimidine kinase